MLEQGWNGCWCEQVFVGFISRMLNVYPMPSKAGMHILRAHQNFMCYEGIPETLPYDRAADQKTKDTIDLKGKIQVADSWSELVHPNQNTVESLGVNPMKRGAEAIMNQTGVDVGV